MTDTDEMTMRHSITDGDVAELAAAARENYAKFKSHFDYRAAAQAYRNMLFDTLLRRITILSDSGFGCAGEILFDGAGPYLRISEAGFINSHLGSSAYGFWEKNFGYRSEIRHLENALNLDLKTPQITIVNEPGSQGHGRFLAMPALSGSEFVGIVIVACAPHGYTQESIDNIQPTVDVYSGVLEYLRADAARAAAEEKNPIPVNEIPAIVFNCNNDAGRSINYIGGQVASITGHCASDFAGDEKRNYASLIDHEDRARVAKVIEERIRDGRKYEVEYRILRADGSKRRVYEQGSGAHDSLQGPLSIDGCTLDLTESWQADVRIRHCRKRFQTIIEDLTRKQLALRDGALQAVRAKSDFISNMSHELRTPIHAILSYSKMGIEDCGAENHEAIKEYFDKIQHAGRRLFSLISNVLDISKMDAGKLVLSKSLYDFLRVAEDALSELDPLIRTKRVNVTTEVAAQDTRAVFDCGRMGQVVANLISNAVRFSSPGDTIHVCLADGRLPDGGEALCCSVADDGAGIPEGELEEVFGKFIQSSNTKTGAGGSGLGLSICREIVEAHGGRIWAENRNPRGAKLSFTIPKSVALRG